MSSLVDTSLFRIALANTPHSNTSLADLRAQLGLLPQPVAYALATLAAVILVVIALKVIRKVVGKIIGVIVSLLVSVGFKLFIADPQFHIWVTSLFH